MCIELTCFYRKAISASLCSVIGIYVCHVELEWDIFHLSWNQTALLTESTVTRLTVRFFIVSNIADICIGLIEYPSQAKYQYNFLIILHFLILFAFQLFILTTWIHHGAYVLLCCWMLKSRQDKLKLPFIHSRISSLFLQVYLVSMVTKMQILPTQICRCSILFGICLLEEIPTAIIAYGISIQSVFVRNQRFLSRILFDCSYLRFRPLGQKIEE